MYNIKRNTLQIEPTTCPMTPFLITAFPWPLITKRRKISILKIVLPPYQGTYLIQDLFFRPKAKYAHGITPEIKTLKKL